MTEKQKRFADEWLIDINATRAYKAAYPNCKSDNTAKTEGCKLLTKPNVQEYIQKRRKELEKRTEITQDKVLKELGKVGLINIEKYEKKGMEIKTTDKIKALELLGRHLGMFNDKLSIETDLNITWQDEYEK